MSASPDRGRAAATSVGRALVPVLLAFVVGGVVLAVTGQDPLQIYRLLLEEAFGGGSRIDATLAAATPLLFTAVAAAFAYRAGVFTIGAEGSFTLGGLAAAVVGAHVGSLPPVAAVGSSCWPPSRRVCWSPSCRPCCGPGGRSTRS